MVHCAWFRRIEISGSARQCQQRHLRLSPPQQAPPRPRYTSAWRPSRHFTRMVTPKTRREKRKHAIVVHVRSNRGVIWDDEQKPGNVRFRSIATELGCLRDVRFPPVSDQIADIA